MSLRGQTKIRRQSCLLTNGTECYEIRSEVAVGIQRKNLPLLRFGRLNRWGMLATLSLIRSAVLECLSLPENSQKEKFGPLK